MMSPARSVSDGRCDPRRLRSGLVGNLFATRASVLFVVLAGCRSEQTSPSLPDPTGPRLAWVFEAPHPGSLLAAPAVTADGVYLAASHARGFEFTGTVYALDLVNGRP